MFASCKPLKIKQKVRNGELFVPNCKSCLNTRSVFTCQYILVFQKTNLTCDAMYIYFYTAGYPYEVIIHFTFY